MKKVVGQEKSVCKVHGEKDSGTEISQVRGGVVRDERSVLGAIHGRFTGHCQEQKRETFDV